MGQDVDEGLLHERATTHQFGLGRVFWDLYCNSWIDCHFELIAGEAPLPHIRVMALDALLSGQVR